MDANFWHQKWKDNVINFHEGVPNSSLTACFTHLALNSSSRIFVPLCGKSVDMHWLKGQGHHVIGAELSEKAIQDFFTEANLTPTITEQGPLKRYSSPGYDLYVGDIFDLTADLIGPIHAIYDRAASVALPWQMRTRYIAHVGTISQTAPMLLIVLDYDQSQMKGLPFSIPDEDVATLFGETYTLQKLSETAVTIKGISPLEKTWILMPS